MSDWDESETRDDVVELIQRNIIEIIKDKDDWIQYKGGGEEDYGVDIDASINKLIELIENES